MLGVRFFIGTTLVPAAAITLLITGIGAIGRANNPFRRTDFQCARLGIWMHLPLTNLTLLANMLMAGMATALLSL